MAFARKEGGKYLVRKGTGAHEVLGTFGSMAAAAAEVEKLHAKHKPKSASRGKSARKAFVKDKADGKLTGPISRALRNP